MLSGEAAVPLWESRSPGREGLALPGLDDGAALSPRVMRRPVTPGGCSSGCRGDHRDRGSSEAGASGSLTEAPACRRMQHAGAGKWLERDAA